MRKPNSYEYKRLAWERLKGKWGISLVVSFIAALFGCYSSYVSIDLDSSDLPSAISSVFGVNALLVMGIITALSGVITIIAFVRLVLGGAVRLGLCSYYNRIIKGEEPPVSELFSRFSLIRKAIFLTLYTALLTFAWSLLFIIPGIVASYRYSLAFYILSDHPEYTVRQCVNESKRLMAGYKGRLFCLNLSFIGWAMLNVLTLGIGSLWLNPYMSAATSAFYLERVGEQPSEGTAGGEEAQPEFVLGDDQGPQQL